MRCRVNGVSSGSKLFAYRTKVVLGGLRVNPFSTETVLPVGYWSLVTDTLLYT